MKKLLLATALCAVSFGSEANAFLGGSFDYSILMQNIEQVRRLEDQIKQGTQQLQQGFEQLNQLKSQLDQMKQLYSSLNGKTDLSALQEMFNKQGNNSAFPSDFNQLQQSIEGSSGGGNAEKWKDKLLYKEPSGGAGSKEAVDAFYKREVEKLHEHNVGQAATGQAIYEEATKKKEAISKILEKLKYAKTAAEVQDAQTQLAVIQAMLQAEALQTQATAMIQEAQAKAEIIRAREESNKRYTDYAKKIHVN